MQRYVLFTYHQVFVRFFLCEELIFNIVFCCYVEMETILKKFLSFSENPQKVVTLSALKAICLSFFDFQILI